jgi:DNA-directed RNA polymerase subunit RPC12/RpoP
MVCGICKGPLVLLGKLGNLKHYRCRNCGAQFSKGR